MIICPYCRFDVSLLGDYCLCLLVDCIEFDDNDSFILIDVIEKHWKLHKNGIYRPSNDLQIALRILERNGYVISTELSQRYVAVILNKEKVVYDEENDTICWCGRESL